CATMGALMGDSVCKYQRKCKYIRVGPQFINSGLPKLENLTHEDLVRRASSLVTDSANTYLSQTTLALLDSFSGYIKVIKTIIVRYVASMSKLTSAEEDAIWQVILRQPDITPVIHQTLLQNLIY
uniref:Uncharacterized protein n=1 Tax=Sinocyclocheilus anshuiensis TaxID=1608454 RepID=A0A671R644_9TELE